MRPIPRARLAHRDLTLTPGHLLRRAHQRSQEIFNRHLAPHALTQQQAALLIALQGQPGASLQRLADATGTDRNTLAELVPRLLRRGLLRRRRSQHDARAYELALSASGARLLSRIENALETVQREIVEPLPPRQRAAFIRALRRIAALPVT